MTSLSETKISAIKKYIREQNFSQYIDEITEEPDMELVNEFSECFDDVDMGTPLLALEATCKFLLTTTYLFWWDDCVEYNYEPIDNVLLYNDDMFDVLAISKKKEDTYAGAIVESDVPENIREELAETMQALIEFVICQLK